MAGLAQSAKEAGKNNIAFISLLLLGKVDECIDLLIGSKRLPEAALFARTYKPSRVSEVTQLWKQVQATTNAKVAQSLADPAEYENLFPGFQDQLAAEAFFAYVCARAKGASEERRERGKARARKGGARKGVHFCSVSFAHHLLHRNSGPRRAADYAAVRAERETPAVERGKDREAKHLKSGAAR